MLPCEYVEVSLVSIGSPNQPVDHISRVVETAKINTKQFQRATVLHLANYSDENFVDISLVRDLFRAKHGSETPLPHIDNDTRITLQWHYTPLDETEVTTHRVLRDSRYQIILRKQDWERPIRQWLQLKAHQRLQQQKQHTIIAEIRPQQKVKEGSQRLKTKLEIDSSHLCQDIAPLSPAPSEWGDDDDSDYDFEWSEAEIIESEPSDQASKQTESNAFWTWSREQQSWFHKNEDQTITWFPGLE